MTTIHCVAGDTGDSRTITLNGLDLTGATGAEGHVWRDGNTVTLTAAVDAGGGTVDVEFGPWLDTEAVTDLTTTARYRFEIEVTFPGGALTWPSGTPDTVIVRPQGD